MRRLLAVVVAAVLAAGGGAAAVVGTPTEAKALPNGLAVTPPMGFNDWNSFGCGVDEQLIEQTADFFVSSGLKDAGYEYVNIDDCWSLKQRNADGHLVPDPAKFPDGIKGTADYVHGKGLKLGIYSSAGDRTCAGYPASFGHETVDAQDFADWGVDYLKYDNCGARNTPETKDGYIDRYSRMRDALAATGRPIVYSLCEWGNFDPATWAGGVGNLWRTTGDISDNWASLRSIVRKNMGLYAAAGPGAWNDPDMLEVGNGGMTDTEYRTHFGLWSMMAAPLLIGTDLRKATPATLDILSNREVIALDQDSAAVQAKPVADADGHVVFAKKLANGDVAVALYNESDTAATISTTASAVGLPAADAYALRDVWRHSTTESAGTIAASVPAHGTAIYRVSTPDRWSSYPPAVTSQATAPPAYPGAPVSVVAAGSANPVSTAVTNDGRVAITSVSAGLTAPDGWTVRATSGRTAAALPSGASLSTQWTVEPPAGTKPGTYPLTVTSAYSWAGHPARGSGSTTVLVAVPPTAGTHALSDLDWLSADNDWGPVERDTSNGETAAGDGHTITINGATYAKGLGTNAPSHITYYVGKTCSSLATDVGIDDEKDGSVALASFQVYADGVKVADSGPMTAADPARHLTADLSGVSLVQLVANDEGSANSDHTDWAGPVITCG
ncbi:NPCBM/NEW2 domain-containing protein [Actinocatenispora rupis]|uniref:Alpha-galactosidase n=1 Tax=Actinocatenispora rupis TaxID=519421 RepID=A0A8J3JBP5_9ACTN|nr:NPCBM/NEW2 domain-containing protein [Actinocatenispora rupis]GID11853.1 alpha-galactosidase [Actinocatenispora rupis]